MTDADVKWADGAIASGMMTPGAAAACLGVSISTLYRSLRRRDNASPAIVDEQERTL